MRADNGAAGIVMRPLAPAEIECCHPPLSARDGGSPVLEVASRVYGMARTRRAHGSTIVRLRRLRAYPCYTSESMTAHVSLIQAKGEHAALSGIGANTSRRVEAASKR